MHPGRPPRPRFRRNADEHFRNLERAAAAGDFHARAELFIARLRQGVPIEEIALETLGSLSVRELQGLHYGLANDLAGELAIARHTRPNSERNGGWFPNHERQDVCPRGHAILGAGGFDINKVAVTQDRARTATLTTLVLDGDDESFESDVEWTSCRQCSASWPNTSWEY